MIYGEQICSAMVSDDKAEKSSLSDFESKSKGTLEKTSKQVQGLCRLNGQERGQ